MREAKKSLTRTTYLSQQEKKALDLLAGKLKNCLKDNLVEMRLFGSKVRGDFDKESDIDILLILKEKTILIIDSIYRIDQEIDLEYDIKTSFKIYSLAEFNKMKDYQTFFYQNIEKEAVNL